MFIGFHLFPYILVYKEKGVCMLFIARAMQRAKGKSSQHPGRALLAQEAPLLKSRRPVQCPVRAGKDPPR